VGDEEHLEARLVAEVGQLGEEGLDLADRDEVVGLVETEDGDMACGDVEHDQRLLAVRKRVEVEIIAAAARMPERCDEHLGTAG
jgi:hypothetical protein